MMLGPSSCWLFWSKITSWPKLWQCMNKQSYCATQTTAALIARSALLRCVCVSKVFCEASSNHVCNDHTDDAGRAVQVPDVPVNALQRRVTGTA